MPVAYNISKQLVDHGHEVTIYTSNLFDEKNVIREKESVIDGIKVNYFNNISNKLAWRKHLYISIKGWLWLIKNINKFDILHLHEYRTLNNVIVLILTRIFKKPYIITTHGFIVIAMKSFKKKKIYDLLFGNILKKSNFVHVLTDEEYKDALDFGINKTKIVKIPNGVTIHKDIQRVNFKDKFNIKNDYIFFLGRINRVKGIDLLIQGFAKSEIGNTDLVIAGPDENYLHELKTIVKRQRIEHKVHFIGSIYGDEKIAAFNECKILALTSRFEGMPIVVLEACSFKKPVVITDKCNINDIERYNCGIIIQFDEKELIEALNKLINDTNDYLIKSENAYKLVKEKYTWDSIVQQVEKLYKKSLGKKV
ncbi:MAG: glycosyltransferase [Spirochaetota bacterium]|nr:glycosyltransferase [Spirochaetota bacterium]